MVKITVKAKTDNKIDEFVQEIQKYKMRELWGNKFDDSYNESLA